jgi:hypothetical protein
VHVFCRYWLALHEEVQLAHTVLSVGAVAWQAETWYCELVQVAQAAQVRSTVPPQLPWRWKPGSQLEVQAVHTGLEVLLQVPFKNVPVAHWEASVQARHTRSLLAVQGLDS